MTREDLRLSAEMCNYQPWLNDGIVYIHHEKWQPHKNPAQWQECMFKLFEYRCAIDKYPDSPNIFVNCDGELTKGTREEAPVLALAELKRRMK